MTRKPKTEEEFWNKVDVRSPDECWDWQGRRDKQGYGKLQWHNRDYSAHRLSFELTYGEIEEGLCILHQCDRPSCCNPFHLRKGTQMDNIQDKMRKGRAKAATGERNVFAKLTQQQVRQIRNLNETGLTYLTLSRMFNCHYDTVRKICLRATWKHL